MFDKFKSVGDQHILVIGDIILDKYIHGKTNRISPEAPVPIVLSQKTTYVLGGAANVANNLTALGAKVYLMGMVGDDRSGDVAIDISSKVIYDTSGILRSERATTTKTRIVSKGQQMLRVDEEDVRDLSINIENKLCDNIIRILQKGNISGMVLQDYNKGVFSESFIEKVIALADEFQLPFFVDPKFQNFWNFKGATLFKPNLLELRQANRSRETVSLDDLLRRSAKELKCKILICTLAEKGIAYIMDGSVGHVSTQKIDVIDVSGAGDTSLSIMVIAYLLGYDITEISQLANLAGKLVCMKSGVSTLTLDELRSAYFKAL